MLALDGIVILDFGQYLAGPFGPMLLADLGATVIKIEPVTGDGMRMASKPFFGCQRGKRSLALNMKRRREVSPKKFARRASTFSISARHRRCWRRIAPNSIELNESLKQATASGAEITRLTPPGLPSAPRPG